MEAGSNSIQFLEIESLHPAILVLGLRFHIHGFQKYFSFYLFFREIYTSLVSFHLLNHCSKSMGSKTLLRKFYGLLGNHGTYANAATAWSSGAIAKLSFENCPILTLCFEIFIL